MAGGEHAHSGGAKRGACSSSPRGRVEALLRELPSGERVRVAMHRGDAHAADLRDGKHRQRGEPRQFRRHTACRLAQALKDAVGALDFRVSHPSSG